MFLKYLLITCFTAAAPFLIDGSSITAAVQDSTQLANYELARKFRQFTLGGKYAQNSMSIYPREINGTDNFWFDFTTSAGIKYYYVQPARAHKEQLFDNDNMAAQLSELTRTAADPAKLSLNNLKFSKDQRSFTFEYRSGKYEYDRTTKHLKRLEKEKEKEGETLYSWMNFSPDKRYIIYAKKHNLYFKGNKAMGMDTTEVRLTTDGVENCSYAREEDANMEGEVSSVARWCPDSRHAYAIIEDNRKLRDFWVVNSLTKYPELIKYKYEYPGDKYVTQCKVVIIDVVKRTARTVDVSKYNDQYVLPISMTDDSRLLFIERINRAWNKVDVCSINTSTLEVRELIHEEDNPYRDYHSRNTVVMNNGKDILFRSERTGWGHYYHYDSNGQLRNTVTSGKWVAGHFAAIDTLGRTAYMYGYGHDPKLNPYYYQLFKVHFDRPGAILLTPENGQHRVNFLSSNRYFIDTYSRVDKEPVIVLKDNNGRTILNLATPDLKAVYEAGWKKPEAFTVKAADMRTDLYGVMWKPSDFDPNKKYPIISVVYPGPYFGFVPTNFTLDDSYCTRMAQLGFIVITVGHRGDTPMRGKLYHTFGYGNMRDYPLADDKFVIEQLAAAHPYIDIERVGIYGHSGGGFMAAAAICTYPDFYKAAVSCSGNHDNNIYNRGWGECYNGVQEIENVVKDSLGHEHKEYDYKFSVKSNAEIAKNLKGHLLLVTGDMDKNVNPCHTYRMAQALIEAGKDFDMLVIPGAGHGYGSADEYFEQKMYRYFAKYLLGDSRAEKWGNINKLK